MGNFYLDGDIEEIVTNLGDVAKSFSGKTLVLTGGCGFLGRYFTRTLDYLNKNVLAEPLTVIAVDNLITSGDGGANIPKSDHITFVEHDIIKPLKLNQKIDYVMHAAGIASPYYYRTYPLQTLDVGITGTRNMLEVAKARQIPFLFFSSSEIYGDPDPKHVPTSESYRGYVSCLGERACYDESKRVGETLCRIYKTQYNLATKMVRPFNVYGPGMGERDYRVLPNFGSRIVGNRPLKIYGSGTQTRTFCYITDAINGFLRTLIKGLPGEPYNIGNPNPEVSMIQLAEEISTVLKRKIEVDKIEYPDSYPADEPQRRCPNISKAELQLGFKPKVSLHDGLKRFFSWAMENYKGLQA